VSGLQDKRDLKTDLEDEPFAYEKFGFLEWERTSMVTSTCHVEVHFKHMEVEIYFL
jgi:hypothetical protein